MWKIITDSLKATVKNIELVIVLFLFNISYKYFIQAIGKNQFILLLFFNLLMLLIMPATTGVLINYKKSNNWKWKEYIKIGCRSLPFILAWLCFLFIVLRLFSYLLLVINFKYERIVNDILLGVIVYITSFFPIAISAGKSFQEAMQTVAYAITEKGLKLISLGIYIFIITILTAIVIFTLWNNALISQTALIRNIFIVGAELVRSFAVVVILATLVSLYAAISEL